ncbi:MAG: hypothetical protein JO323_02020 [Acidobacteriia bacterium]|nr:hypothetical protein [Terriglobia bacterium]
MSKGLALVVLFMAAALEAAGDALVRSGIRSTAPHARLGFCLAGAVVLFLYGWTVNTPPWEFGRLLGMYVVFFFLVAQILSVLMFGQWPTRGVLLGGALILCGGAVIAFSN